MTPAIAFHTNDYLHALSAGRRFLQCDVSPSCPERWRGIDRKADA